VRAGASSFRQSKQLAEELVELAAGLLAWTVLALAAVVILAGATRTLPLPLAAPLTRLLPGTAAAAPALPWSLWLMVVTTLLVTSLRLLAIERSYARRPREERTEARDLAV
jgi:hypothetical protein